MRRKRTTLQAFIMKRLKEQGETRYAMARACGLRPSGVYGKLKRDVLWSTMAKMLAFLGAEIRIGDSVLNLSLDRRGQVQMKQDDM